MKVKSPISEARSGVYELKCTQCKSHLFRDVDSDWSEVWWWSRISQDRWEYKEHDSDSHLLDLRGFRCECSGEVILNTIYWVWSKLNTRVVYKKVRIECDERDVDYIVQQINELTKEKRWNVTVE